MALSKYMKLGINDNPVRTFGDPAYIRLPIAKVVENNTIALKTTLKTSNTSDIVSIDSNHLIYFL